MTQIYITKQEEVVDMICHRHYGRTAGTTEKVHDANPGLAALGPILPFATTVTLPDISTKKEQARLTALWD